MANPWDNDPVVGNNAEPWKADPIIAAASTPSYAPGETVQTRFGRGRVRADGSVRVAENRRIVPATDIIGPFQLSADEQLDVQTPAAPVARGPRNVQQMAGDYYVDAVSRSPEFAAARGLNGGPSATPEDFLTASGERTRRVNMAARDEVDKAGGAVRLFDQNPFNFGFLNGEAPKPLDLEGLPAEIVRRAAKFGGSVLGSVATPSGAATSLITPEAGLATRAAVQGGANAGLDVPTQLLDVFNGTQDNYDLSQTGFAALTGAAVPVVTRGAAAVRDAVAPAGPRIRGTGPVVTPQREPIPEERQLADTSSRIQRPYQPVPPPRTGPLALPAPEAPNANTPYPARSVDAPTTYRVNNKGEEVVVTITRPATGKRGGKSHLVTPVDGGPAFLVRPEKLKPADAAVPGSSQPVLTGGIHQWRGQDVVVEDVNGAANTATVRSLTDGPNGPTRNTDVPLGELHETVDNINARQTPRVPTSQSIPDDPRQLPGRDEPPALEAPRGPPRRQPWVSREVQPPEPAPPAPRREGQVERGPLQDEAEPGPTNLVHTRTVRERAPGGGVVEKEVTSRVEVAGPPAEIDGRAFVLVRDIDTGREYHVQPGEIFPLQASPKGQGRAIRQPGPGAQPRITRPAPDEAPPSGDPTRPANSNRDPTLRPGEVRSAPQPGARPATPDIIPGVRDVENRAANDTRERPTSELTDDEVDATAAYLRGRPDRLGVVEGGRPDRLGVVEGGRPDRLGVVEGGRTEEPTLPASAPEPQLVTRGTIYGPGEKLTAQDKANARDRDIEPAKWRQLKPEERARIAAIPAKTWRGLSTDDRAKVANGTAPVKSTAASVRMPGGPQQDGPDVPLGNYRAPEPKIDNGDPDVPFDTPADKAAREAAAIADKQVNASGVKVGQTKEVADAARDKMNEDAAKRAGRLTDKEYQQLLRMEAAKGDELSPFFRKALETERARRAAGDNPDTTANITSEPDAPPAAKPVDKTIGVDPLRRVTNAGPGDGRTEIEKVRQADTTLRGAGGERAPSERRVPEEGPLVPVNAKGEPTGSTPNRDVMRDVNAARREAGLPPMDPPRNNGDPEGPLTPVDRPPVVDDTPLKPVGRPPVEDDRPLTPVPDDPTEIRVTPNEAARPVAELQKAYDAALKEFKAAKAAREAAPGAETYAREDVARERLDVAGRDLIAPVVRSAPEEVPTFRPGDAPGERGGRFTPEQRSTSPEEQPDINRPLDPVVEGDPKPESQTLQNLRVRLAETQAKFDRQKAALDQAHVLMRTRYASGRPRNQTPEGKANANAHRERIGRLEADLAETKKVLDRQEARVRENISTRDAWLESVTQRMATNHGNLKKAKAELRASQKAELRASQKAELRSAKKAELTVASKNLDVAQRRLKEDRFAKPANDDQKLGRQRLEKRIAELEAEKAKLATELSSIDKVAAFARDESGSATVNRPGRGTNDTDEILGDRNPFRRRTPEERAAREDDLDELLGDEKARKILIDDFFDSASTSKIERSLHNVVLFTRGGDVANLRELARRHPELKISKEVAKQMGKPEAEGMNHFTWAADQIGTDPGSRRVVGQQVENAISQRAAIQVNRVEDIFKGASKVERRAVRELLISERFGAAADITKMRGNPAVDAVPVARLAEVARMATEARAWFNEHRDYLKDAGVTVGNVREYLNRIVDEKKVRRDPEGFVKLLTEQYLADDKVRFDRETAAHAGAGPVSVPPKIDPVMPKEVAELQARAVLDRIIYPYSAKFAGDLNLPDALPKSTKARVLSKTADVRLAPFYIRDPADAMRVYAQRMATAAEQTRRFGPRGEVLQAVFDDLKTKVPEDSYTMGHNAIETGRGVTRVERNFQSEMVNGIMSIVQVRGILAVLGRTATFQTAEPILIASRLNKGLLTAGTAWARQWDQLAADITNPINGKNLGWGTKGAREGAQIARAIGVTGALAREITLDAVTQGKGRKARALTSLFLKLQFTASLTHQQRVVAIRMAEPAFRAAIDDMASGKKNSAPAHSLMGEYGVDVPAAKKLATWLDGLDDLDFATRLERITDDTSPEAAHYRAMLGDFAKKSVVEPTAADLPTLAKNPYMRASYGIASFAAAFTREHRNRAIRQMATALDPKQKLSAGERLAFAQALVTNVALYAPVLGLLQVLRETQFGSSANDEEKTIIDRALTTADAAGLTGNAGPIINTLFPKTRYNTNAQRLVGSDYLQMIAGDVDKINAAAPWNPTNTPKNNTAEYNAAVGAYDLVGKPAIAATTTLATPGPLRPAAGIANMYLTSNKAGKTFADLLVGPKGSPTETENERPGAFRTRQRQYERSKTDTRAKERADRARERQER